MTLSEQWYIRGGHHVVRSLSAMGKWIKCDFPTLCIHQLCDLSKTEYNVKDFRFATVRLNSPCSERVSKPMWEIR